MRGRYSNLSPPPSPIKRLCHNQRETTSVARRNRRSGDEALERKPFIAQLRGCKPMKRIPFLRRPITHNFKRPHSKTEEPDPATAGFRRNLPSLMIATQSPRGRGYMGGWNELQQITNQTYLKFPQYILPLRRGRTKVGVDKIDPPPLHPLPRWGGEFQLEIFKVLEINSQT